MFALTSNIFGQRSYRKFKRFIIPALLLTLFIVVCTVKTPRKYAIYYTSRFISFSSTDLDRPPAYHDLRKWEESLPQHNLTLKFPEGSTGRYVLFSSSREDLLGWNNKLIVILMDSWLAYKSGRAYVFHDFAWNDDHYTWPIHKFRDWTPRTPINALISGPSAGAAWGPGDTSPRAISQKWFDVVCPKEERRYIDVMDVKPSIYLKDGATIFAHWQRILRKAPERCIEIVAQPWNRNHIPPEVFDHHLLGSPRSLSLWDEFKNSNISKLLAPSPIVNSAIEDNQSLFFPEGQEPPLSMTLSKTSFDHVLSIHVRRGDFKNHCEYLWNWNSTFYNWNLLTSLPDRFEPPAGASSGKNTPENLPIYFERCYPEISSILKKIKVAKEDFLRSAPPSTLLSVVYIMTNDRTSRLDKLKAGLNEEGWMIAVSSDLTLNAVQKDVGMAVDMEIGRRSAVFIGNGWSSFTSNIVHRRLVDGKDVKSIRFL